MSCESGTFGADRVTSMITLGNPGTDEPSVMFGLELIKHRAAVCTHT